MTVLGVFFWDFDVPTGQSGVASREEGGERNSVRRRFGVIAIKLLTFLLRLLGSFSSGSFVCQGRKVCRGERRERGENGKGEKRVSVDSETVVKEQKDSLEVEEAVADATEGGSVAVSRSKRAKLTPGERLRVALGGSLLARDGLGGLLGDLSHRSRRTREKEKCEEGRKEANSRIFPPEKKTKRVARVIGYGEFGFERLAIARARIVACSPALRDYRNP